jgi:hypothetical protein
VLIDISSATLRKMVKLSERKEALLSQIQELDRQMAALQQPAEEGGGFIRVQPSRRASATKSGAKGRMERGALKAKIIAALRAAGRGGMTIRELSDKLGVKPANLYVWFNGTGRKTKGVKKVGPAKYKVLSS